MKTEHSDTNAYPAPTRLVVGFATSGRPEILRRTVALLGEQTRKPDRVIISAIVPDDCEGASLRDMAVEKITDGRGLAQQRNCIRALLAPQDVVVFLDDDFLPCPDFLARVWEVFVLHPDIVMITGRVLIEGILGPGLDFDTALSAVRAKRDPAKRTLEDVYNGYGCNMAIRAAPMLDQNVLFDENLPLYAWLEDVDFSRRLAPFGRIVRSSDMCGVHLGTKSGRTSGFRLGYSQVVNPYYLCRKGSVAWGFGLRLASKNIVANCVKSAFPEPYIDRIGRLKGNIRGLREIISGKADPKRITEF